MKPKLADAIAVLHAALVAFFALGWALPWRGAWWAVLIGGTILLVIWRTRANQCPLTVLEARLRNRDPDVSQPRFVAVLVKKICAVTLENSTADVIAHSALLASMTVCVLRLA